ncbi:hypothetical protein FOL47_002241 [Perkinsus chesapeaki]|uniref:Uncharacterized protein n=1 Tax=Perkinsus chesapeaki TaxID=330153 RepID=A0A7J6N0C3_PERCH|nr:hypothetical protein FOL47_002241 [Perkinsus chesapeaki]
MLTHEDYTSSAKRLLRGFFVNNIIRGLHLTPGRIDAGKVMEPWDVVAPWRAAQTDLAMYVKRLMGCRRAALVVNPDSPLFGDRLVDCMVAYNWGLSWDDAARERAGRDQCGDPGVHDDGSSTMNED